MRYLFFHFLISFLTPALIQAQGDEESNVHFFNMRLHYGSMIIHSRELTNIGSAWPKGVELSVIQQPLGKSAWESCNCYPGKGFTLGYWNFDKPEILGKGYSANFFIEPVFGGWNRVYFSVKAMMGIAYLTNPYDSIENPSNLSYSTHISFPLHLGVIANYRINNSFNAGLGLIYNHLSNGGLKEPNKGINWPTLSLGIDYKPFHFVPEKREPAFYTLKNEKLISVYFTLFGTGKQLNHSEFKKYIIAGASLEGSYRISKLSAIASGADFEWDETDREEIRRDENKSADHKKAGIFAGHQFLLGRFTFSQSLGVYLYAPYNPNDAVYQRYSLLYKPGKRFTLGIRLKAHRHVADYLALEVGYKVY